VTDLADALRKHGAWIGTGLRAIRPCFQDDHGIAAVGHDEVQTIEREVWGYQRTVNLGCAVTLCTGAITGLRDGLGRCSLTRGDDQSTSTAGMREASRLRMTIPDPGEDATCGANPYVHYDHTMGDASQPGVDLSGIHSELDKLKSRLCRCQHQGTCMACKGFEVIRQQVQVVAAAASQPVLMQVAQEVQMEQLMGQLGGLQEKLSEDPQLQELMARMFERVQDDLGGPEQFQQMLGGLFGGMGGFGGMAPEGTDIPPDDRPIPPDDRTIPPDDRTAPPKDNPTPPSDRPTPSKD
jgi:hypothetical protein